MHTAYFANYTCVYHIYIGFKIIVVLYVSSTIHFYYLIHFFQVNNSLGVVDSAVSVLINKLKENNIYDCVNIIIVSDHGELMLKVNQ